MEKYFDETGKEYQKPEGINPEWRISGYALIQSSEDKILMVQSMWNKDWELPGGGIEIAESINKGIVRECYEETGYKVQVHDQPILVGERNFYSRVLDKFFKAIIIVYSANLVDNTQHQEVINTVEKNEIANVEWVRSKELNQSNVHPIVWPAISKFLQTRK